MSKSHSEFYATHNISPVSQDITDLNLHFQRRESLFRSLGLPPSFIADRSILEFGPGSGHNALFTASLSPRLYELVDGNPRGIADTCELLKAYKEKNIHVYLKNFEEFDSPTKFDLVWAEGCLPHQKYPLQLLKKMAAFVEINGILCISTNNGISYLSETLRRLFRDRFFDTTVDIHEQTRQLLPYLTPHLNNLKHMSRSHVDWILDSIVQPLGDRELMSIPDVVETLKLEFDVYGSSPRFLSDWRWYKEIVGERRQFNNMALSNYYQSNLNLLDYRHQHSVHKIEFGEKLEDLGNSSWRIMCRIEKGESTAWKELFALMNELIKHIARLAPDTADSIYEAVEFLEGNNPNKTLKKFPKWWGRGQQYLSLIRKQTQ
jgi:SAM-dependent methyltransferase